LTETVLGEMENFLTIPALPSNYRIILAVLN
jgi:hypothetical protein